MNKLQCDTVQLNPKTTATTKELLTELEAGLYTFIAMAWKAAMQGRSPYSKTGIKKKKARLKIAGDHQPFLRFVFWPNET